MGKLTEIIRRQKAHGEDLRAWLQDRAKAAEEREKEQTKEFRSRPRGVDRVPDRLKFGTEAPKVIVAHEDDNYQSRRTMAKFTGRRVLRTPVEVIAPMREKRVIEGLDGKQVVHLQKQSKGRKIKGEKRSSMNRPHVNPKRSKFKP